jgi:16S rRNA processing protein RimM
LTKKSDLVIVARVKGAFGVNGEVRLATFTEAPENCVDYGPLLDEAGEIVLTPASHRTVKAGLALRAPEVVTREDAEALKGVSLYVPRSVLPEPEEDEFYYEDLVGMEVKSTDGKRVGKVIAVHDFGASDMLEIKPKDAASFFHPFTKVATPKVDMKAGRIIVEIVEAENGKAD